jgi:Uma2 family endonuclease
MTTRNRFHCFSMTRVARYLDTWLDSQPQPRGQVLTGDAGVRLRRDPDTTFGVDVVYISAELLAQQTEESSIIDGVPILSVEILSPNDVLEDVEEKIDAFLNAGVPLVWVVNPRRRTVTLYRPDAEPELLNVHQELSGEPHLPGFRVAVRTLFE